MLFFKDPRFNRLSGIGQQKPVLCDVILSFFIRFCQGETCLQTVSENLFDVTTPMQNGNHLQRLGARSINNQVGVDREELHPADSSSFCANV